MKFKSILLTALATLGLTAVAIAQNICQTIGTDSLSLYQNQYYTGPGLTGASCAIHTESKWVNTSGSDSIYFKTIQHRLYDNSKIYDENNQLIWSWNGESVPAITWYTRYHTLNISGNDSIRIEVYQGYNNFCTTRLQLLNIYCSNPVNATTVCQTIGTDSLSLYQNQYYTGPGLTGASCAIHTESKWINTSGSDSIYFKTIQHRLYDNSKIYDENNQLIWSWNGESVPAITWYTRYHTLNISGNDSIRIEVYQGYNNFCTTRLQLLNIYCSNQASPCNGNLIISPQNNSLTIGTVATFNASTSDPNPSYVWQSDFGQGYVTLNNYGNYSGVNTNSLSISNVQLPNHTQQIRVISTSDNCIDTSNVAVINILDTCLITVYDTLLTTVTDTLVINTQITGINPPNNLNTLKVFPNPASTHITIDYGNFIAMSGYSLKIVNAVGQTVFTTPINQQTSFINLSTWTGNGIYFVQLIDPQNNTIENRKIVIQ